MDYNEILEKARGRVAPYCKACPVCNGIACAHNMPGPGPKQPGNGAARNYEAWQRVFVNMDTICSNDAPDTTFKLYGHEFSLPEQHYNCLEEMHEFDRKCTYQFVNFMQELVARY